MKTKRKEDLLQIHQTSPHKNQKPAKGLYQGFSKINGKHSYRQAAPDGFVDYKVRRRRGGKVAFFNFDLAKEMGLIPADHPHKLTPQLCKVLIDTFAIVIINEWDIEHGVTFPQQEIKEHPYMATRYLQLQHPSRRGTTSGDGRGIWNGEFKHNGVTWDITSSGTGATCLSPAVALEGRYFKTGDPKVCYGDGYNTLEDGFTTALMSEIFHRNGIPTERTLTLIEFPKGKSVNVRAGQCLLRPSHFFLHLKQGNYDGLKGAIDYFMARDAANRAARQREGQGRKVNSYKAFAEEAALRFSRLAALFETEYVFCWMDWDGDNLLANAGIIDYGSIRQFGLFHDEYRYDDVDRYSTKLSEQRLKARYTVQTFAQIQHFLTTKKKKNIKSFRRDPLLRLFDRNFDYWMDRLLLVKVGFSSNEVTLLMSKCRREVTKFRKAFSYFERLQSKRGVYEVSDGITSDAVFCMRDLLRELPKAYQANGRKALAAEEFIAMARSSYAKPKDLLVNAYRRHKVREFQKRYGRLLRQAAERAAGGDVRRVLTGIVMRSARLNRHDRVTGNGIVDATQTLLRYRKTCTRDELHELINQFVRCQVLVPVSQGGKELPATKVIRMLCERMMDDISDNSDGV